MKTIEDAVKDIYTNIDVLSKHEPVIGKVFHQSFAIAVNTIEAMHKEQQDVNTTDITNYLTMLNGIFGISMQELVEECMRQNGMEFTSSKEADQATLDFIMKDEDLDDYERFIKENQTKDNLDFLKNEI